MKRYLLSLALLCLVATGAHAYWQSRAQVVIVTGGASPTVTYVGIVTPTLSTNVATATNANIGAAASDRLVVVLVYDAFVNITTTTMTIGGSSATLIGNANQNGCEVLMFSLPVAAGTTATIVATATGGSWNAPKFDILNANQLSSFTAVGTNAVHNAASTSISTTLATSAGGVVIVASGQGQSSATTDTITGTETYTTDSTGAAGGNRFKSAHATGVAANASSSVTATFDASGLNGIAVGSWF